MLAVVGGGMLADGVGAWRISWVEETAGVWGVVLADGVEVLRTSWVAEKTGAAVVEAGLTGGAIG